MSKDWVEVPARPAGTVRAGGVGAAAPAAATGGSRSSEAQNALYHRWMAEGTPLALRLRDGTTLEARLLRYDTYALHLQDAEGRDWLVFKHAVNAIVPPSPGGGES
ncbi:conserved protein of unknown function [Candidatus Hydrogenisulfobacillus filiaventi]|uniref:RNA chaperone Hfq n=1 Tax=Candidatus Hydrogenisulfobacillus filiaventi TaxID=2707344 RepID=A0A6F8ZG38_9FIRM|nr:conserved protein of unknown function [Candidatus Hydrogenisulfobacillus filiaventi]